MVGSAVPLLDFSAYAAGGEAARALAQDVDAACRRTGFLMLANHGLDPQVADAAWRQARRFFDTPLANRMSAAPPAGQPYGYHGFAGEALAYSLDEPTPPDLKETFNVGPLVRPRHLSDPDALAFAYARNHWPAAPAGFREALEAAYRAFAELADRVLDLFALALALPRGYFRQFFTCPISALRVINYPEPAGEPLPGQLRAGAHSDYGALTLLLQETGRGGLQVHTGGAWQDVPAIPGTLVVNLGDLMARWTNDRWVSTLHRVVNPAPDGRGATRRQSLVFFHTPDWDAEIACLPGCLAPGTGPRHAAVRAGPHLAAKFRKTVA